MVIFPFQPRLRQRLRSRLDCDRDDASHRLRDCLPVRLFSRILSRIGLVVLFLRHQHTSVGERTGLLPNQQLAFRQRCGGCRIQQQMFQHRLDHRAQADWHRCAKWCLAIRPVVWLLAL